VRPRRADPTTFVCSRRAALQTNPIGVRRLQGVRRQKVPKVARRWRSRPQQCQRWRMVNFLTVKTTVPRPQVLAASPGCAPAHPKHDPVLTNASPPCAPAGRAAVLLWCILRRVLVAGASRQLRACGCSQSAAASGCIGQRERRRSAMVGLHVHAPRGASMCGWAFCGPMRVVECVSART